VNRTLLDRPPVLELYERHDPAGLDVDDRHRAAALPEQSLGDPDAAQDGALPHPWPSRQAELGDRYEVPELGTSDATSEIGMVSPEPGTPVWCPRNLRNPRYGVPGTPLGMVSPEPRL
jgi:hypothetical protein